RLAPAARPIRAHRLAHPGPSLRSRRQRRTQRGPALVAPRRGAPLVALISQVTEAAFVTRRHKDWVELESLTRRATDKNLQSLEVHELTRVSPLYRDICADLARAQAARYSA